MIMGARSDSPERRAGVIGWPLGHSISPAFQQPAFDACGLAVSYQAIPVPPEGLDEFISGLRTSDAPVWLGVNVTIPHKEAVAKLVDDVTEEARLIGAVNTVICEGGRLTGHNTDAEGFLRGLTVDGKFDPVGARTLVIGSGGASRAICVALLQAGVHKLSVANRSPERAESLVWHLQGAFPGREIEPLPFDAGVFRQLLGSTELLVNTTSIGMAHGPSPDTSPVPVDAIRSGLVVYDLVYNPAETPLLRAARMAGARPVEGLPMLIYQGAASFARWTGVEAPVDVMFAHGRRALEARNS